MNDVIQSAVEVAVRATPDLQRLRGTNLFITGGTGFIGTWLLESIAYLNDQGHELCRAYVLTRDPQAIARKAPHLARRPEFTFLPGDVRSLIAPAERCDYIIHAAASASLLANAESPVEVGETISEGTRRVLEFARQWKVEGMLFLSSGAVYGVQPPELERVPEDFRGGPDLSDAFSTYAEGKRFAEVLCLAYHQVHEVPVVIARPFTFVGPYQALDGGFAVTDFIRDGLRGAPLHIKGMAPRYARTAALQICCACSGAFCFEGAQAMRITSVRTSLSRFWSWRARWRLSWAALKISRWPNNPFQDNYLRDMSPTSLGSRRSSDFGRRWI